MLLPLLMNLGMFGVALRGGKGDNERRRKTIHPSFKPTGLVDRPQKKGRDERVEQRLRETREIHKEIVERAELQELSAVRPITQMTMAEIDAEIGLLLRRKIQEDENIMLLMLLASS